MSKEQAECFEHYDRWVVIGSSQFSQSLYQILSLIKKRELILENKATLRQKTGFKSDSFKKVLVEILVVHFGVYLTF
jgi:hypothetical protein